MISLLWKIAIDCDQKKNYRFRFPEVPFAHACARDRWVMTVVVLRSKSQILAASFNHRQGFNMFQRSQNNFRMISEWFQVLKVASFAPQNLANAAWSFAKLQVKDDFFMSAIASRVAACRFSYLLIYIFYIVFYLLPISPSDVSSLVKMLTNMLSRQVKQCMQLLEFFDSNAAWCLGQRLCLVLPTVQEKHCEPSLRLPWKKLSQKNCLVRSEPLPS